MGWTALRFSMTQPKPTACSVRKASCSARLSPAPPLPIQFRSQPGGTPYRPRACGSTSWESSRWRPYTPGWARVAATPPLLLQPASWPWPRIWMVGSPCTIIMNQMACIMPVKRRSPTLAIWTSWFPAMGATVHFLSLSWRRTGAMPGWTPMYCSPPPRRAPWCTTPPTPSPPRTRPPYRPFRPLFPSRHRAMPCTKSLAACASG